MHDGVIALGRERFPHIPHRGVYRCNRSGLLVSAALVDVYPRVCAQQTSADSM